MMPGYDTGSKYTNYFSSGDLWLKPKVAGSSKGSSRALFPFLFKHGIQVQVNEFSIE
jgi:hypothetical protein